jgi:hypothetical protein
MNMKNAKLLSVFAVALAVGVFSGPVHIGNFGIGNGLSIATDSAYAAPRHAARRTARRTTRRTVRRLTVLPAGCVWRAPYHYCGGVYYQPVVEGGTTVYIVVNP